MQVLEPRVGGLDENLRLVAGAPQRALNAEHFVPDRIAIAQRGEHLVDGDAHLFRSAVAAAPPPDAGRAAADGRDDRVRVDRVHPGRPFCRWLGALPCGLGSEDCGRFC